MATPLSKKWSKSKKHDLIDGRRGTYFDNVAGDYATVYAVSFEAWSDL